MKIYNNMIELIGNTPLVRLSKYANDTSVKEEVEVFGNIIGKLEKSNPGGSVKDRIAKYMIEEAEKSGKLKKGGLIIEPTSGNTGIGIASIGAAKGYRVMLVMPETMSVERRELIKAYGAEVVLTKGAEGMAGAVSKAEELSEELEGAWMPRQFENEVNSFAHLGSTGPEIWEDTDGNIDIFISAIGTGGTVSGVGKYLKSKNNNVKIIGVEPAGSPILSGGVPGPHKIQGIGANFIPHILDNDIYDEIVQIKDEEAFTTANDLAKSEGILCGISSGAALAAAYKVAKREENKNKNIVVILPDTGERYLSTGVFK